MDVQVLPETLVVVACHRWHQSVAEFDADNGQHPRHGRGAAAVHPEYDGELLWGRVGHQYVWVGSSGFGRDPLPVVFPGDSNQIEGAISRPTSTRSGRGTMSLCRSVHLCVKGFKTQAFDVSGQCVLQRAADSINRFVRRGPMRRISNIVYSFAIALVSTFAGTNRKSTR